MTPSTHAVLAKLTESYDVPTTLTAVARLAILELAKQRGILTNEEKTHKPHSKPGKRQA